MTELLCHLVGDYVLQNHVMADRKVRSWGWAGLHAVLYTLPFLFLTRDVWVLGFICGTHLIIDRYRLAGYWVRFWGTGVVGWLPLRIERLLRRGGGGMTLSGGTGRNYRVGDRLQVRDAATEAGNGSWTIAKIETQVSEAGEVRTVTLTGLPAPAPEWMATWLLIIADNTMHMTLNHLALNWTQFWQ